MAANWRSVSSFRGLPRRGLRGGAAAGGAAGAFWAGRTPFKSAAFGVGSMVMLAAGGTGGI